MKLDKRKVINKTYIMGATAIATVAILGGTAFCADDPLKVITNLSDRSEERRVGKECGS